MSLVEEFFQAIDREWTRAAVPRVRLQVIGSGALMLQVSYERGTKDSDILETIGLSSETKDHLVRLAGPGTVLHERWKLYLDIVSNGIPFLPAAARWRPVHPLNAKLASIELQALDVVDVVVSKLKRFSANDQADIDAMIQRGLVPHRERWRWEGVKQENPARRPEQALSRSTPLHRMTPPLESDAAASSMRHPIWSPDA